MEETDREAVITRRAVDAMDAGELLRLVRRHAGLLGERFPKRAENFYAPEITDLPHLLRRLYRLDPAGYREMTGEQCKRDYLAGRLFYEKALFQNGYVYLPQPFLLPKYTRRME